jgi:SAF domain-containing protein
MAGVSTGRAARTASTAGAPGREDLIRQVPGPVLRRRVSAPRVLLGSVLVVALAITGAMVGRGVDRRVPVLMVARAVAAGQIIADGDVAVVRVAVDGGVSTVPASRRSTVVGRIAAVPLMEGSLLTLGEVGAVVWPPQGQALAAVAVKPGHAPAGLSAGMHVMVLVVPLASSTTGGGASGSTGSVVQAPGVVVTVGAAADQSGMTVVSLLLGSTDATTVVSATGDVSLIQVGESG